MRPFLILSLVLFVAGGCASPSESERPPPDTRSAPVIEQFDASTTAVVAGDSVTLRWRISGEPEPELWIEGVGNPTEAGATNNTLVVNPTQTTTYMLTASNELGKVSASVTVEVSAPSDFKPIIDVFGVTSTIIRSGQSPDLFWVVTADPEAELWIDGIGDVTNIEKGADGRSRVTVSPKASDTYTLTATNKHGTTTANVDIEVREEDFAPVIHHFSATPNQIGLGDESGLLWIVSGSPEPHIWLGPIEQYEDEEEEDFTPFSEREFDNAYTVRPRATTAYTLRAINDFGESSATVTVTVITTLPRILKFEPVQPAPYEPGDEVRFEWEVAGEAVTVTINGDDVSNTENEQQKGSFVVVVEDREEQIITLTATNRYGNVSESFAFGPPPEIASFTAEDDSAWFGEEIDLHWELSGGTPTRVTLSYGNESTRFEDTSITGATVSITNPVRFRLTVSNDAGSDFQDLSIDLGGDLPEGLLTLHDRNLVMAHVQETGQVVNGEEVRITPVNAVINDFYELFRDEFDVLTLMYANPHQPRIVATGQPIGPGGQLITQLNAWLDDGRQLLWADTPGTGERLPNMYSGRRPVALDRAKGYMAAAQVLKSVIMLPDRRLRQGMFMREFARGWGNVNRFLSGMPTLHYTVPAFGTSQCSDMFPRGCDEEDLLRAKGHWGFASGNGVLGGFDVSSDVQMVATGEYEAARPFNPFGRVNNAPFSALEMYLMGFASAAELEPITVYPYAHADHGRQVSGRFDASPSFELLSLMCTSFVVSDCDAEQRGTQSIFYYDDEELPLTLENLRNTCVREKESLNRDVSECDVNFPPIEWTIEPSELLERLGERNPSYIGAPRIFRGATLILVEPGHVPSEEELDRISDQVSWLTFESHDNNNSLYNFWEMSEGRASILLDRLDNYCLDPSCETLIRPEPSPIRPR